MYMYVLTNTLKYLCMIIWLLYFILRKLFKWWNAFLNFSPLKLTRSRSKYYYSIFQIIQTVKIYINTRVYRIKRVNNYIYIMLIWSFDYESKFLCYKLYNYSLLKKVFCCVSCSEADPEYFAPDPDPGSSSQNIEKFQVFL